MEEIFKKYGNKFQTADICCEFNDGAVFFTKYGNNHGKTMYRSLDENGNINYSSYYILGWISEIDNLGNIREYNGTWYIANNDSWATNMREVYNYSYSLKSDDNLPSGNGIYWPKIINLK